MENVGLINTLNLELAGENENTHNINYQSIQIRAILSARQQQKIAYLNNDFHTFLHIHV